MVGSFSILIGGNGSQAKEKDTVTMQTAKIGRELEKKVWNRSLLSAMIEIRFVVDFSKIFDSLSV